MSMRLVMYGLEYEFLEEYKKIDSFCRDIYQDTRGVSMYLEDMERQSYYDRANISSWDADYKMLKHLRWLRNKIAHETQYDGICAQSDIDDVIGFYNRLLSQEDPLALLRKSKEEIEQRNIEYRKAITISNEVIEKEDAVSQQNYCCDDSGKKAVERANGSDKSRRILMVIEIILAFIISVCCISAILYFYGFHLFRRF